jgi:hypothetical protein
VEGALKVSQVRNGGLLASSPLAGGFKVLSIDNFCCEDWSSQKALEYLRRIKGEVIIVAQNPDGDPGYVQAMAYKTSPRATVGISFRSSRGYLKIGTISASGIFTNSVLNAGDDVVAINNTPSQHMTSTEAADIVRSATGSITILSKPHQFTGIVLSHLSSRPATDTANPSAFDAVGDNSSVDQREKDKRCTYLVYLVVVVILIILLRRFY